MSFFRPRPSRERAVAGGHTPLARTADLVVEAIGDEIVVYDQRSNHAHALAPAAARVWRTCDGRTPVAELGAAVGLDGETVARALKELEECELLDAASTTGVTRREVTAGLARVGAAAAVGAPLIYSIAAPKPAAAATIRCITDVSVPNTNCFVDDCRLCPTGCKCCTVATARPEFTRVATLPANGPYGVAWATTSAGTLLAFTNYNSTAGPNTGTTVSVFSVSGTTIPTTPTRTLTVGQGPRGVAFNADGTLVAVTNYQARTVSLFSVSGNTFTGPTTVTPTGSTRPEGLAWGRNTAGTLLAVGDDRNPTGTPSVYSVSATPGTAPTYTLRATFPDIDRPREVAFNPAGTLLAVTNNLAGTVSVYSVSGTTVTTSSPAATRTTGGGPYGVAFNPAGTLLVVANNGSNSVSVFTVTGTPPTTISNTAITLTVGASPFGVAFNATGTLLAVANSGDSSVSVFPVNGTTITPRPATLNLPPGSGDRAVAFSPDGTLLAVADTASNDVSVFELTHPKLFACVAHCDLCNPQLPVSCAATDDFVVECVM